jgi:hypothetical protein
VLKKPSNGELSELKRLSGTAIERYLQTTLEDTKTSLVANPDIDTIRVLQGQAQTLSDLLKFISL